MLFESLDGVSGFPFQPFADRVNVATHLVEALPRAGAPSRFTAVVERLRARLGPRASSAAVVGGHYLQLDRPEQLSAQLLTFAHAVHTSAPPA
jgi:hypothetical protein